jgi:hypothetical protein
MAARPFIFTLLSFALGIGISLGQREWFREPTPKGTFTVGAGPTFLGLDVKVGGFLTPTVLVGLNGEIHEMLSSRREIGLFARKYVNTGRFSLFVQTGPAYGRFQAWGGWNIDSPPEPTPQLYKAVKLNGMLGGEIRFSRMLSMEASGGVGFIARANWWAPSLKSALNIRLNRH